MGDDQDGAAQHGRFLTIADTAEVLNVSVGRVYQLVHSGEIPAIRIGSRGQWRIEADRLESFIDGQYEETRRRALWAASDLADIPEFGGGRIV